MNNFKNEVKMFHIDESHSLLESHKDKEMKKVIIESRFSAPTTEGLVKNKKFTLACMRDCFMRGEAPYASHVIYAQTHILDDFVAAERAIGMHAGFLWGDLGELTVVYTDLGISTGMQMGIDHAIKMGRKVEYRELGYIPTVSPEEVALEDLIIKQQKALLETIKQEIHPDSHLCLSNVNKSAEKPKLTIR
jgi:hypothetical protein